MSTVEHLLVEYTRRRKSGMQAKEIIQTLQPQIKALSDIQKQSLKMRIRTWETEYIPVPADSSTSPFVENGKQPTVRHVRVETHDEEEEPELVDIICHFCGRLNRPGEVMCHACGRLLDPSQQFDQSTRILRQTSELFYSDEFFGDDFVLLLSVRDAGETGAESVYEVRPQDVDREITIGRSAYGSNVMPDIDLSEQNAEQRGVSRIHASFFYDPNDHVIGVIDQGSANGTFVNGQRLHRSEVRILRNGDELRLGKMVFYVKFFTYDFS